MVEDNIPSIVITNPHGGFRKNAATPKSYLIGSFNPLKNIIYSVGMIIHNMWKKMFQTTNQ